MDVLLLKILSKVPTKIWYASRILWVPFIYRFYRRKIAETNLKRCFPALNTQEILDILKQHYGHLFEVMVENITPITHPEKLLERCHFDSSQINEIRKIIDSGKHVVLTGAHIGNWEMIGRAFPLVVLGTNCLVIYQPIKDNKDLERYINSNRSCTGAELLDADKAFKKILSLKKPTFIFCLLDQSPIEAMGKYWLDFFGINTPFYKGLDRLFVKIKAEIFFCDIYRTQRGNYAVNIQPIFRNKNRATKPHEIVTEYAKILENCLQKRPYNWLWTHKRWKVKTVNPARDTILN